MHSVWDEQHIFSKRCMAMSTRRDFPSLALFFDSVPSRSLSVANGGCSQQHAIIETYYVVLVDPHQVRTVLARKHQHEFGRIFVRRKTSGHLFANV